MARRFRIPRIQSTRYLWCLVVVVWEVQLQTILFLKNTVYIYIYIILIARRLLSLSAIAITKWQIYPSSRWCNAYFPAATDRCTTPPPGRGWRYGNGSSWTGPIWLLRSRSNDDVGLLTQRPPSKVTNIVYHCLRRNWRKIQKLPTQRIPCFVKPTNMYIFTYFIGIYMSI